jgi:hypothetical protein
MWGVLLVSVFQYERLDRSASWRANNFKRLSGFLEKICQGLMRTGPSRPIEKFLLFFRLAAILRTPHLLIV